MYHVYVTATKFLNQLFVYLNREEKKKKCDKRSNRRFKHFMSIFGAINVHAHAFNYVVQATGRKAFQPKQHIYNENPVRNTSLCTFDDAVWYSAYCIAFTSNSLYLF